MNSKSHPKKFTGSKMVKYSLNTYTTISDSCILEGKRENYLTPIQLFLILVF